MEEVIRRNGSREDAGFVAATMVSLRALFDENAVAAYDIVALCRDPKYEPWTAAALKAAGLLASNGTVHDSVRNVVLSAVTGEGVGIVLGDPVAS